MDAFTIFIASFFYIFVIIDPFVSLAVFIESTKKMHAQGIKDAARHAVIIAGVVALIFLFAGNFILETLRIELSSFKIAAGIVLALLGIEIVFGINLVKFEEHKTRAVASLIGVPLLTGPGLISTLIILVNEQGYFIPLLATLLALFVSWIILDNAIRIREAVGWTPINVAGRVIGLFLIAIAISYIKQGFI